MAAQAAYDSRKHWAVVHDWLMAGSRDVIFDVMMNGLHHLQDVKKLQGLQSAWKELRAKAYAACPPGRSKCSDASAAKDVASILLVASGRP